jgi:hypothetical protein
MQENWSWYHTFGLLALVVASALFGLLIPTTQVLLAWLLTLGALLLFAMLAGHGVTGRFWLGWLINEQHRVSLSRLQMALWTVVVLSAFLTTALFNIRGGHASAALDIAIPEEVWIAMGISTTSLVGSPLILSQKKRKRTNTAELKSTLVQLGKMRGDQDLTPEMRDRHASGNLYRHASILIGAYAANLGGFLVAAAAELSASSISAFPPLGASSIALLGISTAGFLAGEAVDKQPEGG